MQWLRGSSDDDEGFDDYEEFVPENLPAPGPALADHEVLTGDDHVAVHRQARDLFEEYGVYDATFGYNLARLNLDHRHPEAGFRYAREADDPDVLRAEFTPTTEFCPQGETLGRGAFRAWNSDDGPYRLVKVRVRGHQHADATNRTLRELEQQYLETGELVTEESGGSNGSRDDRAPW